MEKNKPARRDFIKLSAMALGGIAIAPGTSDPITKDSAGKQLNILCLGAHPGDPEGQRTSIVLCAQGSFAKRGGGLPGELAEEPRKVRRIRESQVIRNLRHSHVRVSQVAPRLQQ